MNNKDIKELFNELSVAFRMSTVPDVTKFPKYKEGTVLDENKTVKWNREQVELANTKRVNEVSRLQRVRNNAINDVENKIAEWVADDLNISIKKAKKLYREAYDVGHSFGTNEIYISLEHYMDIVRLVLED